MEDLSKNPDLIDKIRGFQPFENIPDKDLEWLIQKSSFRLYKEGEYLFHPDQTVDHMKIVVDGEYMMRRKQGSEFVELGTWETGTVTGLLPFSRMKKVIAYGIALRDTYLLELHKDYFTEMVGISYELTQNLVAQMSDRIRDFTHQQMQNEKLMSLGKLSAGLAHELNNPASSIVRNVEELYRRNHQSPERFKKVITMRITPEQTDQVNEILFSKLEHKKPHINLLERESLKDDMLDWLEDHAVQESEVISETLIEFGITINELEKIDQIIEGKSLESILLWIESMLSLEQLAVEIREASSRIATLINSIKSYTHMDQGSDKEEIDLKEGIMSTLTIFRHQLRSKSINVETNLDDELPRINGFSGELNQVWTNIFDNAIDAWRML